MSSLPGGAGVVLPSRRARTASNAASTRDVSSLIAVAETPVGRPLQHRGPVLEQCYLLDQRIELRQQHRPGGAPDGPEQGLGPEVAEASLLGRPGGQQGGTRTRRRRPLAHARGDQGGGRLLSSPGDDRARRLRELVGEPERQDERGGGHADRAAEGGVPNPGEQDAERRLQEISSATTRAKATAAELTPKRVFSVTMAATMATAAAGSTIAGAWSESGPIASPTATPTTVPAARSRPRRQVSPKVLATMMTPVRMAQ